MNKFLIIVLFVVHQALFGQGNAIQFNISLFNESTAIPFTKFFTTPVHPGLQLGTEFNYKIKNQSRLSQTVNISYFYHNYLAQAIGLNSEFGYERRFKNGLALNGLLGIGYIHTFATTEEFTFSNGEYEKKADKGSSRLFPSLSFDIGYYLKKTEVNSPKVFIRYQSWAEYPYSPGFIPIMTHINLHMGVKLFIKLKKTND